MGNDYHLVTSSFEFSPSVLIFHSHDLIHYERYVRREFPAATGLFGTAKGLLTVGQMLLNHGTFEGKRILAPMTLKAMTTPQTVGSYRPIRIKTSSAASGG